MRYGASKKPLSLVVTDTLVPIATLVIVTDAPGMTPWVASRTVPLMVPRASWADDEPGSPSVTVAASTAAKRYAALATVIKGASLSDFRNVKHTVGEAWHKRVPRPRPIFCKAIQRIRIGFDRPAGFAAVASKVFWSAVAGFALRNAGADAESPVCPSRHSRGIDNPPSTWMIVPVAYGMRPPSSAATARPTSSG